ncbi:MAG: hypothetical protein GX800_12185 [Clostridiaceae bacterium]|nr:hypothetical protein [Clostridiaceae bacterium]
MNFLKSLFTPILIRRSRAFYDEASPTFKNIMFWLVVAVTVITVLVIYFASKVDAS